MIKIGIVGVGHMGSFHAKSLLENKIDQAKLVAVMDIDPSRLEPYQAIDDVKCYQTFQDFIEDKNIDAVIIATPHFDHPTLGKEVLLHHKHLLIEKPAGVYTKNVIELNEVAKLSNLSFSIMYNQRTNPLYIKLKSMIDNHEIGQIKRIIWIVTDWYRSTAYYQSSSWRATWEKEGGGVLLNQAPHQLDLWQWMFGMPNKIRAHMKFGAYRNISVENDVTVYLEYDSGCSGVFIASTIDAPGTNRLEVVGTKGNVIIEKGKMTFYRLKIEETVFDKIKHSNLFAQPPYEMIEFDEFKENAWGIQHQIVLNNFVNHIIENKPLIAPGVEGVFGLTISNAMHLSAFTDKTIELKDFNHDQFLRELEKRINEEKKHAQA
jgi:predicted dehydrogenase